MTRRSLSLLAATAAVALALGAAPAFAGECPADARVPAKLISADIFHVPGGDKHMM